ncbi:glycoside hydrolase family 25 protein, partial [Rhodococcus erythropolis]|nr:glycoside hydrolase family 25 protein [Rhodococcus erythropolis]
MVERRIVRTLGKLTPIAMAAAIAITAPGLAAADAPRGPDVSSWQHVDGTGIDWFQVKASGHEFAMVKATESLNYVNPYFIQDCLVMRAAGVSRGAYHYADVRQSPEAQAAFYSAIVLGINGPGDLPPVLDLEDAKGLPAGQVIDWTHRYLNTVQAL